MKRSLLTAVLLGLALSSQAVAHHMAEGIISDELWNDINDRLLDADSPHLDLDLSMMPGSINAVESDSGDMYLESYVVVYFDDVSSLDPTYYVQEFLDGVVADAVDDMNKIPSGTLNEDTDSVYFEVKYVDVDSDGVFDYAEVYLYEPIGYGNSQGASAGSPAPGNGNANGD